MPRLVWAAASSGLSRIASRYSATASATFPWAARALPRLMWAAAKSGWSRIASRYAATASAHFPWAQGDAEVVVGRGVVGLEPDRLR